MRRLDVTRKEAATIKAQKSGPESANRGSVDRGDKDHEVYAPSLKSQAYANGDLVGPYATL